MSLKGIGGSAQSRATNHNLIDHLSQGRLDITGAQEEESK